MTLFIFVWLLVRHRLKDLAGQFLLHLAHSNQNRI